MHITHMYIHTDIQIYKIIYTQTYIHPYLCKNYTYTYLHVYLDRISSKLTCLAEMKLSRSVFNCNCFPVRYIVFQSTCC